jgi:uncharacterized membrane protein
MKISKPWSIELLLLFAIAIATVLRIIFLDSREFWYDEILSLLLSSGQKSLYQSPERTPVLISEIASSLNLFTDSNIFNLLPTVKKIFQGLAGDVHPPLFYVSLYFWRLLFGSSETAVRSLGVGISLLTMIFAYGLGKTVGGYRSGLCLAALLGLSPFYFSHSLNARMYSLLVLCAVISARAAWELVAAKNSHQIFWELVLIVAIASGLLTQYLFLYWTLTIAIFLLASDRHNWWKHCLRLSISLILFLPWFWWGTRQQLRNRQGFTAQISDSDGVTPLEHLQDVAQALGSNLVIGEWISSLPSIVAQVAGYLALAMAIGISFWLWQKSDRLTFIKIFILALSPLLIALTIDCLTGKLTVGFGWGRSMIFIVPGCLLLLVTFLETLPTRWRVTLSAIVLVFYLSVTLSDFTMRSRSMFHQIAATVEGKPTLIAMNSFAWGNVLRLAYYLPTDSSVKLLANNSAKLPSLLEQALKSQNDDYSSVIWIDFLDPVWGNVSTLVQKQQIETILQQQYQIDKPKQLQGTSPLDSFTLIRSLKK